MKFPELHNFNDMFTPPEAMKYIMPFLNPTKKYWEACWGRGDMANELFKNGFDVVGNKDMDCLLNQPEEWDFFITNPPFNGNKKFIKRAIELKKPFALLIRLEHLGGGRSYEIIERFRFSNNNTGKKNKLYHS